MINVDYVIERKLSDNNIQVLKPNVIPSQLPNIVYIEGPNDSGKSTMLNLVALAFFGIKNDSVKDSLKLKLKNFINSDYQRLKFSVEIFNKDKSIYLRAKKEDFIDNDIVVEENISNKGFKSLSWESFNKRYNLIYDIPERPTERLGDLLNELELQQYRIGENVKNVNHYIRDVINEINEYKNPERINTLKNKIIQMKEDITNYGLNIPTKEKIVKELKQYYYFMSYCKLLNEFSMINDRLEKLKKRYKDNKGKKIRVGGDIQELQININRSLEEIFTVKNEIKTLVLKYIFDNDKKKFKDWDEIPVFTKEIIDERLTILVGEYLEKLEKEIQKIVNDSDYKGSFILNDIIQYLEKYENLNIELTKLELNLKELIGLLKEENKKYEKLQLKYNSLNKLRESLEEIKANIITTNHLIKQVSQKSKEKGNYTDIDLNELKKLINEDDNNLKETEGKLSFYSAKCIECNIDKKYLESNNSELIHQFSSNKDLEPFFSLRPEELYSRITSIDSDISSSKSDCETKKTLIDEYKKELSNLESKGEHKYEKYLDKLNLLFDKSEKLSGRILFKYTKLIKNVKENNIDKKNEEEDIYYNEIFKYLAKKIDKFWYMDKQYAAEKIDLLDNIIYTKEGIMIRIADLGTGRGQSAYLTGLLNIYDDNRKIIALFDEIAAMDRNSLKPIFNKIYELYSKDKLLVGMLVQKLDDKVNIIPVENLI